MTGKTAVYEFSELDQIEHSYAITVHKSQGSEFDVVILPITRTAPMLLTRNLLYTAITRAKKLLIVIRKQRYSELYDKKHRRKSQKYRARLQNERDIRNIKS